MDKTLMLFGLGDLGGWALEFLARREGLDTIIAVDIREDWGTMKVNCAAIGASQEGYSKTMKFEKCDVNDTDATAELINKYNPDVIYTTLTLLGWMKMRLLPTPPTIGAKSRKASAMGTPLAGVMTYRLMEAVKESGTTAHVVNNSYPDIVNPVLCRNGFPILVGAGNLDLLIGRVRRKISIAENVPIQDITIYLIAEHALHAFGTRTGVPYFFKTLIGDKDITSKVDVDSLISDRLIESPVDQTSWLDHPAIASSAVRNIMAIINDTNEFAHAPGPNGLLGGYPVRISAKGVEIVTPEGISMEEAIKINTDCAKHEGLEELKDDGTLVLTDEAYAISKELYGAEISMKQIKLSDWEDISEEMLPAIKGLADKYKV